MTFEDRLTLFETRRHFFRDCGVGVGRLALGSLLMRAGAAVKNPMASKAPRASPARRRA